MAQVTLKGNPIETVGNLPALNTKAANFTLTGSNLADVTLAEYKGKNVVLNIFASLDTATCAASVRRFNQEAAKLDNTVVLCISADLPFAAGRFCETEGIKNVVTASVFRAPDFGTNYGVTLKTGPLAGLLSRSIVVIDKEGNVAYTQQVPEVTEEPNYEPALEAVAKLS